MTYNVHNPDSMDRMMDDFNLFSEQTWNYPAERLEFANDLGVDDNPVFMSEWTKWLRTVVSESDWNEDTPDDMWVDNNLLKFLNAVSNDAMSKLWEDWTWKKFTNN